MRSDPGGTGADNVRRPIRPEPVIGRHVIADGGMLAVARRSGMGRNPLTIMEDFDGAGSDAHPELLFDQWVWHRVIVPVDINVVINPGPSQLPFRINIRFSGQRLQRGFIERLEQGPTAGPKMTGTPHMDARGRT